MTTTTPDLAAQVTEIWARVLGVSDPGPNQTFLELHGQSILAVRLAGEIEDELGIPFDMDVLFDDPTLIQFIDAVAEASSS